ncbi:MAG: hypothetical protein SVZ03_05055 [Spirochaetota bacterium]|nr:hypothetical protein [Spirochaetota bacterium]
MERKVLQNVYDYWNNPQGLADRLNKHNSPNNRIAGCEIHERYGENGFNDGELGLLCLESDWKENNFESEKEINRRDICFRIAIQRLKADKYIEYKHDQVVATDKGVMAATDSCWVFTIFRENKTWLLSLIISLIALMISIMSLMKR